VLNFLAMYKLHFIHPSFIMSRTESKYGAAACSDSKSCCVDDCNDCDDCCDEWNGWTIAILVIAIVLVLILLYMMYRSRTTTVVVPGTGAGAGANVSEVIVRDAATGSVIADVPVQSSMTMPTEEFKSAEMMNTRDDDDLFHLNTARTADPFKARLAEAHTNTARVFENTNAVQREFDEFMAKLKKQ